MHTYKNVVILGTSHIAKQSIEEITRTVFDLKPDIVCVELDKKRYHAMLTDAKPNYSIRGIRQYGLQGYLFAVIGAFLQKKLGNVVGIKPGSDMLTACKLAEQQKIRLLLIDQDIEITLKRFSKLFSFREKMRLVWDIISAPFSKKKRLQFNLHGVPEQQLVIKLITELKNRYPGMYKALIEERNHVMARNIQRISESNTDKKIFVVIGAGHEPDIIELIKKEEQKRDKIY